MSAEHDTGDVEELASLEPSPEEQTAARELRAIVGEAYAALPTIERHVLRWRFLHDLSLTDVGNLLGRSRESVRQIQNRAVRTLRTQLRAYR